MLMKFEKQKMWKLLVVERPYPNVINGGRDNRKLHNTILITKASWDFMGFDKNGVFSETSVWVLWEMHK